MTESKLQEQDSALLAKRALQIHRGGARAAVLGVNDGLVSTLCIVLAVAAAAGTQKSVLLAGFAGLIAGAISMAAGEWISVRSQVDLFKGVLSDLNRMMANDRDLLTSQLADNFKKSGLDTKTAHVASDEIARDDMHLRNEYARNVMGINPEELGSPWTAAFSSFALFTAGSLVALAPWLFSSGTAAILSSIFTTSIAGLVVGGYVSRSSGSNIAKGSIRQFLIILFAAAVTYGVGHIFGALLV